MPREMWWAMLILVVVNWIVGYGIVSGLVSLFSHFHWIS